MGTTLQADGWPARESANGRTGRMHGLQIVSAPARKDQESHVELQGWAALSVVMEGNVNDWLRGEVDGRRLHYGAYCVKT
jgi:hypothetical protein